MSKFDFNLSEDDIELTRKFMMYTVERDLIYFSSDDFRNAGLADDMQDPAHQIGVIFAKWTANSVTTSKGEVPSEIPSNNLRKVDLWRWNWQRWREIVKSRLEAYV